MAVERTCRNCGCTEARACTLAKPDHPTEYCSWAYGIDPSLCTACVEGADPAWVHPVRVSHGTRDRLVLDGLVLDDAGVKLEVTDWPPLPTPGPADPPDHGRARRWGRTASEIIRDLVAEHAPAIAERIWPTSYGDAALREHPATPLIRDPSEISMPLASTTDTAIALGRHWLDEYSRTVKPLEGIWVRFEDVAGKVRRIHVEPGPLFAGDGGGFPEATATLKRDQFDPRALEGHHIAGIGGSWQAATENPPPDEEDHMDPQDRTPPHGDALTETEREKVARRIDFATEIPPRPRAEAVPAIAPGRAKADALEAEALRRGENIRIVSDGSPRGTHVYAGDEEVAHVTEARFEVGVGQPATAKITTVRAELEAVVLDAEIGPDPITELRVVVDDDTPASLMHAGPKFVELEQQDGKSVGFFEWVRDPEHPGLRYLRIPVKPWQPDTEQLRDALREARSELDAAIDAGRDMAGDLAKAIDARNLASSALDRQVEISTRLREERDAARLNMARLHNPLSEAAAIDETEGVIPYLEGEVATAKGRADFLERVLRAATAAEDEDRERILEEGLQGMLVTEKGSVLTLPAIRTNPEPYADAAEGVVPAGAAAGVVPANPPQHEVALERLVNLLASSVDQLQLAFDPQMNGAWIITGLRAGPGQSPKVRSGDTFLSNSDLVALRRFHDEVAAERRSLEGRIVREVEAKESLRSQLKERDTELEVVRITHREFCEKLEAHIGDVHAAAQTLITHLGEDNPAWWVEAAGALAELQRLAAPAGAGEEAREAAAPLEIHVHPPGDTVEAVNAERLRERDRRRRDSRGRS